MISSKMKIIGKTVCGILLLFPVAASSAVPRESIFFTPEEIVILQQARQGYLDNRFQTEVPVESAAENVVDGEKDEAPIDRGRRILTLAGVVYQSPQDWTIWLNGERVTPRNIPENIRSLTVNADHVRLRWFDKAENRIVNITLRPHQHYNLDLDTIAPGT